MPDSPNPNPDPDAKPVSDKQLAANRANAARSTGPRTTEGKARSARNAVKHGFTASNFGVPRLEELQEVERLKQDLVSVYQPVNAQEMFALERMALAQQSILRAARLEAGLFCSCFDDTMAGSTPILVMTRGICQDIDITIPQNRNFLLAEGFRTHTKSPHTWTLFLRYQAQAERFYRRALEEFERLKRLRPELPNEPISECEPEETQPLYHSADPEGPIPPGDPYPANEPEPGPIEPAYQPPPPPGGCKGGLLIPNPCDYKDFQSLIEH